MRRHHRYWEADAWTDFVILAYKIRYGIEYLMDIARAVIAMCIVVVLALVAICYVINTATPSAWREEMLLGIFYPTAPRSCPI